MTERDELIEEAEALMVGGVAAQIRVLEKRIDNPKTRSLDAPRLASLERRYYAAIQRRVLECDRAIRVVEK